MKALISPPGLDVKLKRLLPKRLQGGASQTPYLAPSLTWPPALPGPCAYLALALTWPSALPGSQLECGLPVGDAERWCPEPRCPRLRRRRCPRRPDAGSGGAPSRWRASLWGESGCDLFRAKSGKPVDTLSPIKKKERLQPPRRAGGPCGGGAQSLRQRRVELQARRSLGGPQGDSRVRRRLTAPRGCCSGQADGAPGSFHEQR